MWAELQRRLRRLSPDLARWLASWKLSVVLMTLAALYHAFLAIWGYASPPDVVRNIASLAVFQIIYALLLVNTGFCLWRRLPSLLQSLAPEPLFVQRPALWQTRVAWPSDPGAVRRALRRLGYRTHTLADGEIAGVKGRWAALGTLLFHAAFFVLALGFFLSAAMRTEAQLWGAVGEPVTGAPEQVLSVTAPRAWSLGLERPAFRVDDIRVAFWRDQMLFTTLEASLTLDDGGPATTRINRPLWLGWATFLRLTGVGYALRYELRDATGALAQTSFVKLNVFPPGQRDFFRLEGYPHRIYVQVYPDLVVDADGPTTHTMNLERPGIAVRVYRGKLEVASAVLRPGEPLAFEGLVLRVPEIRYWGKLALLSDPGVPWVVLALLLGLVGLLVRLAGARAEVSWSARGAAPGTLRGWGAASRPEGMGDNAS